MTNRIEARYAIRTQNVRDNKHMKAINEILERRGEKSTMQYEIYKDEMLGAAIYGTFSLDTVREISALPIPASSRLNKFPAV